MFNANWTYIKCTSSAITNVISMHIEMYIVFFFNVIKRTTAIQTKRAELKNPFNFCPTNKTTGGEFSKERSQKQEKMSDQK